MWLCKASLHPLTQGRPKNVPDWIQLTSFFYDDICCELVEYKWIEVIWIQEYHKFSLPGQTADAYRNIEQMLGLNFHCLTPPPRKRKKENFTFFFLNLKSIGL